MTPIENSVHSTPSPAQTEPKSPEPENKKIAIDVNMNASASSSISTSPSQVEPHESAITAPKPKESHHHILSRLFHYGGSSGGGSEHHRVSPPINTSDSESTKPNQGTHGFFRFLPHLPHPISPNPVSPPIESDRSSNEKQRKSKTPEVNDTTMVPGAKSEKKLFKPHLGIEDPRVRSVKRAHHALHNILQRQSMEMEAQSKAISDGSNVKSAIDNQQEKKNESEFLQTDLHHPPLPASMQRSCSDSSPFHAKYGVLEQKIIGKGANCVVKIAHKPLDPAQSSGQCEKLYAVKVCKQYTKEKFIHFLESYLILENIKLFISNCISISQYFYLVLYNCNRSSDFDEKMKLLEITLKN